MLLGQTGGTSSSASDAQESSQSQKPIKREEYGPATDEELGDFGRRTHRQGGHGNATGVPHQGKPPFKKKGFKKGSAKTFRKNPRSH
jgi:hypothetical protein